MEPSKPTLLSSVILFGSSKESVDDKRGGVACFIFFFFALNFGEPVVFESKYFYLSLIMKGSSS